MKEEYVPRNRRARPSKWHPRNTAFFRGDAPLAVRKNIWPGWEVCINKGGVRFLREYTKKHPEQQVVRIEKRGPPLPDGITENPDQLEMDELLELLRRRKARRKSPQNVRFQPTPSPPQAQRKGDEECPPTGGKETLNVPTPDPTPAGPQIQAQDTAVVRKSMGFIVKDGVRYERFRNYRQRTVRKKRMIDNPAYYPPKKKRRKSWPRVQYPQPSKKKLTVDSSEVRDLMSRLMYDMVPPLVKVYGGTNKERKNKGYSHISVFCSKALPAWNRKQKLRWPRQLNTVAAKEEIMRQRSQGKQTERQREIYRLRNQLKVHDARDRRLQAEATSFQKLIADLKAGKSFASCSSTPTRKKEPAPAPEAQPPERDPHAELALELKGTHEGYQEAINTTIASVQAEMARIMQAKGALRRCKKLRRSADTLAQNLRRRRTRAQGRKNVDALLRDLTLRDNAWRSFRDRTGHDPFQDVCG